MNGYCMWRHINNDIEDYFETGCNNTFQFITDGIKENNFKYCPYCGKEIALIVPIKLGEMINGSTKV
jgi:hypothetical protein